LEVTADVSLSCRGRILNGLRAALSPPVRARGGLRRTTPEDGNEIHVLVCSRRSP